MTLAERCRVADSLPADLGLLPTEGTPRSDTLREICNTLEDYIERGGRAVFIANDLAVYYPGEPAFVPDLMVVANVELGDRMRWLVSQEQHGVDLAFEIVVTEQRRRECERMSERYARLGIREYFVFDYSRSELLGYRLGSAGCYEPIPVKSGRLHSEVLGLGVQLQETRVRFFAGTVMLIEPRERIAMLEARLAALVELERLRSN